MSEGSPPLVAQLVWTEHLSFDATAGTSRIVIDGDGHTGPSPMQALALAVGGCMAADVVAILRKGRHPLTGLTATVEATRAPQHPKRFTAVRLVFRVAGAVPRDAVERAVELSRSKYCSALLSLRQDIAVSVDISVEP